MVHKVCTFRGSPIPRTAEQSICVHRESMNKDRQIGCMHFGKQSSLYPGRRPVRLRGRSSQLDLLGTFLISILRPRGLRQAVRAHSFLHQRSTACCSYCLPADKLFDHAFVHLCSSAACLCGVQACSTTVPSGSKPHHTRAGISPIA